MEHLPPDVTQHRPKKKVGGNRLHFHFHVFIASHVCKNLMDLLPGISCRIAPEPFFFVVVARE